MNQVCTGGSCKYFFGVRSFLDLDAVHSLDFVSSWERGCDILSMSSLTHAKLTLDCELSLYLGLGAASSQARGHVCLRRQGPKVSERYMVSELIFPSPDNSKPWQGQTSSTHQSTGKQRICIKSLYGSEITLVSFSTAHWQLYLTNKRQDSSEHG